MGFLADMYEYAKRCDKMPFKIAKRMREGKKMDFCYALNALNEGKKVFRAGWNGKGMWVVLQKAYPDGIPINANTAEAIGEPVGTVHKFLPYLMFRTAQGSFVPWLASQTDLLADDWWIMEDIKRAEGTGDVLQEPSLQ